MEYHTSIRQSSIFFAQGVIWLRTPEPRPDLSGEGEGYGKSEEKKPCLVIADQILPQQD